MPDEALGPATAEAAHQQREEKPKEPVYRFPLVQPETAEFRVQLLPFPHAPEGFSGSLDELLAQLRAAALPLEALPLAPLVDQYLAHCERFFEQQGAHERLSDFLPLAATLIHLKSRLLLPRTRPRGPPKSPAWASRLWPKSGARNAAAGNSKQRPRRWTEPRKRDGNG